MLDEFEIALSQITSPTFPRQSWRLQWRTRRKVPPKYWARSTKKWSADIKETEISIWWQIFVGCWENMWWRTESVKEIRYIGHSKIKRFAKARELKEKPKHTLPEKILHLQSYILIESLTEISQFAFVEFPESRCYTAEGLLFKAWEVSATLLQDSMNIISFSEFPCWDSAHTSHVVEGFS